MAKVLRLDKKLPQTWQQALEEFLLWKQAQGARERTLEDYRYHVSKFFGRYPHAFGQELRRCALEYLAEKVRPNTFNLRLEYLRAFFGWCVREGILAENPLAGLKKRKDEHRIVNLETGVLQQLLALPDTATFAGLRDRALFLLMLDTGIRPGEAFRLRPQDVNLRALEIRVPADAAKTGFSRTLPVSPVVGEAIRALLGARHPAWPQDAPVFCTCEGRPLSRKNWNKRFAAYCKALGVKIRPYDLRHTFALTFLRNGGHALALQRMLGHADLTMTKRYVALTQQDIREQHALASPLNALLPRKERVRKLPQPPNHGPGDKKRRR